MPTIAYLTSTYPRASDSFIRAEIAALRAQGITVETFSIRPPTPDQLVSEEIKTEHAQTTYLLTSNFALLTSLFTLLASFLFRPKATLRAAILAHKLCWPGLKGRLLPHIYLLEAAALARHLRRQKITHLHNHIGQNSAAVALLAATLAEIPYSLTIHGPYEFDAPENLHLDLKVHHAAFTAAISHFTRSQLCRWSNPQDWPRIHIIRCGLTEEFLHQSPISNQFLISSSEISNLQSEIPPSQISNFKSEIPPSSFLQSLNPSTPQSLNPSISQSPAPSIPPSPFRLLCVGRLCPEKGQLLLLQSLAQLLHSPDPSIPQSLNLHLTFIGDGPSRQLLESEISNLQLTNYVTLAGWQPAASVRQALLAAHALVLPSFAEGLPVVIMEAMALRRPVVSTAIAGIPELVIPNHTGFLVPAGSVEALTQALRTLLATPPDHLQNLVSNAAALVAQNHDIKTEAAKLAALINK